MLNQSTRPPRLTKTTFLSILAITGVVITAAFFRADAGATQPVHTTVAGTWSSIETGGRDLVSFMSDGRMIYSIPALIHGGNAPKDVLLSGLAHGEWIQTGTHEFVYTAFALNSSRDVSLTRFVKLITTLKLNDTSDELTHTATLSVFFPDGTLDGSFQGGTVVLKRIVAGQ